MKEYVISLILLLLLFPTITPIYSVKETHIIALGIDENFSKYALHSNGLLYKLKEHGKKELVARLNISLPRNYWYEFFISDNKLFLYSFNATKISEEHITGEFVLTIIILNSGNKVIKYKKSFKIINNTLEGKLVSAAISIGNYIVLQELGERRAYLNMYTVENNTVKLLRTFSGRFMLSPLKYGNMLLIVSTTKEKDYLVPIVVDAISSKTLYTLPSLTPVIELANPIIQPFYCNGKWKVYILVTHGLRGGIESYITEPESARFFEYPLTYVNPLMHYAIIIHRENSTSTILFKDGYKVNINYTLGLTALGSWLAMDPLNTVLDVDLKNHLVLAKIINGNESKILLIHNGKQETITTLPAEKAFKEKGLHGVIVDNTVYLVDPDTQKLIVKEIPLEINRPNYTLLALIPIILALIIVGYIVFRRFSLSKT